MDVTFSNVYQHSQHQCHISPDNKYVANAAGTTVVIRGHSQKMIVMHVFETNHPVDWIGWAPNSQYLATMNLQNSIANVWSINDTNTKITLSDRRFGMAQAWWSPDSSTLLISSDLDLKITLWMFIKNEIKYLYQPKIMDIGCVPSPDGKYMAIVEKKDNKDYVDILDAKSYVLLQHFVLETTDVVKLLWSPDSLFLAAIDNCLYYKVVIYRLDGQREFSYSAYEHGLGIKSIAWHDKLLAIGSYDGSIRLINTSSWQVVTTLSQTNIIRAGKQEVLTIYEEYQLPNGAQPTLDAKVGYRLISRRPLPLALLRPEYNKHDPSVGIGESHFCMNGSLLATKNDAMPTTLWIWDLRTLDVCLIILQMNPVRHIKWNPKRPRLLAMVCGDENVYLVYPDANAALKIVPIAVPISKFSVQQVEWSQDGHSLLLLDHHLYCLVTLPSSH